MPGAILLKTPPLFSKVVPPSNEYKMFGDALLAVMVTVGSDEQLSMSTASIVGSADRFIAIEPRFVEQPNWSVMVTL